MDKLFYSKSVIGNEGDRVKKVAILLTSEPESGGGHQYLLLLMEGLQKCDKKYFDVLGICCNRFWEKWCREYKIKHIRYGLNKYSQKEISRNIKYPYVNMILNILKHDFANVIRKNEVDLLICGQQTTCIPKCPCKVIHPVHDLMHRYEPDFPEISEAYAERELIFNNVSRIADVVLVDSNLGKQQFIESYYKKGHFPKIEVLPFVVPTHIKRAKEEYITVPEKYVFYPAQFWEHKNHAKLIKAIKLVKQKVEDIKLVLVGSEKNALLSIRKLIIEEGLEENVSILGFVSDGQITYLYRHAIALVMPSYFGPTNIPPLEAMALGCPVIVSNKYAMGEQVGEAGLLFDPDSPQEIAECIVRVWNDEEKRRQMITEGYRKIASWTQKDFKKKFIKIVLRELGINRKKSK